MLNNTIPASLALIIDGKDSPEYIDLVMSLLTRYGAFSGDAPLDRQEVLIQAMRDWIAHQDGAYDYDDSMDGDHASALSSVYGPEDALEYDDPMSYCEEF